MSSIISILAEPGLPQVHDPSAIQSGIGFPADVSQGSPKANDSSFANLIRSLMLNEVAASPGAALPGLANDEGAGAQSRLVVGNSSSSANNKKSERFTQADEETKAELRASEPSAASQALADMMSRLRVPQMANVLSIGGFQEAVEQQPQEVSNREWTPISANEEIRGNSRSLQDDRQENISHDLGKTLSSQRSLLDGGQENLSNDYGLSQSLKRSLLDDRENDASNEYRPSQSLKATSQDDRQEKLFNEYRPTQSSKRSLLDDKQGSLSNDYGPSQSSKRSLLDDRENTASNEYGQPQSLKRSFQDDRQASPSTSDAELIDFSPLELALDDVDLNGKSIQHNEVSSKSRTIADSLILLGEPPINVLSSSLDLLNSSGQPQPLKRSLQDERQVNFYDDYGPSQSLKRSLQDDRQENISHDLSKTQSSQRSLQDDRQEDPSNDYGPSQSSKRSLQDDRQESFSGEYGQSQSLKRSLLDDRQATPSTSDAALIDYPSLELALDDIDLNGKSILHNEVGSKSRTIADSLILLGEPPINVLSSSLDLLNSSGQPQPLKRSLQDERQVNLYDDYGPSQSLKRSLQDDRQENISHDLSKTQSSQRSLQDDGQGNLSDDYGPSPSSKRSFQDERQGNLSNDSGPSQSLKRFFPDNMQENLSNDYGQFQSSKESFLNDSQISQQDQAVKSESKVEQGNTEPQPFAEVSSAALKDHGNVQDRPGSSGVISDRRADGEFMQAQFDRLIEAIRTSWAQMRTGQLRAALEGGKSELWVQLQPQELGSIKIALMLQDARLVCKMETESEETRSLLHSKVSELKDRLSAHGLQIEKFEVSLGPPSASSQEKSSLSENTGQSYFDRDQADRSPHRGASNKIAGAGETSAGTERGGAPFVSRTLDNHVVELLI